MLDRNLSARLIDAIFDAIGSGSTIETRTNLLRNIPSSIQNNLNRQNSARNDIEQFVDRLNNIYREDDNENCLLILIDNVISRVEETTLESNLRTLREEVQVALEPNPPTSVIPVEGSPPDTTPAEQQPSEDKEPADKSTPSSGGKGGGDPTPEHIPNWLLPAGFGVGVLTLLFFMVLALLRLCQNDKFAVIAVFSLGCAFSSACLSGYATATGNISVPLLENPLKVSLAGGLAALFLAFILGFTLYDPPLCSIVSGNGSEPSAEVVPDSNDPSVSPIDNIIDNWEIGKPGTGCTDADRAGSVGYEHIMYKGDDAEQSNGESRPSDFWIQQTRVTNYQYQRCVDAEECSDKPLEGISSENEQKSVTNITYEQALKYADWVGGRLPTVMEWEIACKFFNSDRSSFISGSDASPYPSEYVTDTMKLGPECGKSTVPTSKAEASSTTGFRVVLESCLAATSTLTNTTTQAGELTTSTTASGSDGGTSNPAAAPQPTRCYIGSTQPLAVATSSAYRLANAAVAVNSQLITSNNYLLSGVVRSVTVSEPVSSDAYRLIPGFWCTN